MLTKEEVKHIAALARIKLTDDEVASFQKDLASVLDFVSKLNEVNTKGVEAIASASGLKNVLRKDVFTTEESPENRESLLGEAPEREGNYVKVKAVFE